MVSFKYYLSNTPRKKGFLKQQKALFSWFNKYGLINKYFVHSINCFAQLREYFLISTKYYVYLTKSSIHSTKPFAGTDEPKQNLLFQQNFSCSTFLLQKCRENCANYYKKIKDGEHIHYTLECSLKRKYLLVLILIKRYWLCCTCLKEKNFFTVYPLRN